MKELNSQRENKLHPLHQERAAAIQSSASTADVDQKINYHVMRSLEDFENLKRDVLAAVAAMDAENAQWEASNQNKINNS